MARNWWDRKIQREYGFHILNERYYIARNFVEGTVLDLGCGYGYGTQALADHCDHIEAFDWDEEGIATAQEKNRYPKKITYQQGDLYETEFPVVDWVVCLEVIEHLEHVKRFMHKALLAAKKGFVISTPMYGQVRPHKGQYWVLSEPEVNSWFPQDQWTLVFGRRIKEIGNAITGTGLKRMYYIGVFERIEE